MLKIAQCHQIKHILKYHDEELELVQKKESLQSELNVIEERKNNRNLRSEKLDEDISYQLDRLGNLQDRLKQREQIKDENKKKIKELNKEIIDLENGGEYNLETIENIIEELKDTYYNLINEETRLENSIEYARKNLESAERKLQGIVSKYRKTKRRIQQ